MINNSSADRKPQIHQKLCSRVLFSESRCEKCFFSCPVGALHISDGSLEIDDKCTGCLFCAASCPNEVFSGTLPDPEHAEEENILYCSALLPHEKEPLADLPPSVIPCLGSIPTKMILSRVSQEKTSLKVITGSCAECRMKKGESFFRGREREVRALLAILQMGSAPVEVLPVTTDDKHEILKIVKSHREKVRKKSVISRRDLFLRLRDRFVQSDQPVQNDQAGERRGKGKEPTEATKCLIAILKSHARNLGSEKTIPYFREMQLQDGCSGCGACANLCPTGALSMVKNEDFSELTWRPAHCSGCDLCLEACRMKAIRFLPVVSLEKIVPETVTSIRRFHHHLCPECRVSFLSTGPDGRCPRCSKTKKIVENLFEMIYKDN